MDWQHDSLKVFLSSQVVGRKKRATRVLPVSRFVFQKLVDGPTMKPDDGRRGRVELRRGGTVQSDGLRPTPTGTNVGPIYQRGRPSEDAPSWEIKTGAMVLCREMRLCKYVRV